MSYHFSSYLLPIKVLYQALGGKANTESGTKDVDGSMIRKIYARYGTFR